MTGSPQPADRISDMAKTASRALSFPSIRALMHCACRSDPIIAADLAELDAAVVWVGAATGARARFLLRSKSFEPQRIPAGDANALANRPTTLPARSCSAHLPSRSLSFNRSPPIAAQSTRAPCARGHLGRQNQDRLPPSTARHTIRLRWNRSGRGTVIDFSCEPRQRRLGRVCAPLPGAAACLAAVRVV